MVFDGPFNLPNFFRGNYATDYEDLKFLVSLLDDEMKFRLVGYGKFE